MNRDVTPSLSVRCVGQALVDGVTAALYNVIFTSVPILLYALLDRPVKHFVTLIRYPQVPPGVCHEWNPCTHVPMNGTLPHSQCFRPV